MHMPYAPRERNKTFTACYARHHLSHLPRALTLSRVLSRI